MIRFWDYLPIYTRHREAILEVVDRTLASGRLILGPEVELFEQRFSRLCGTSWGIGVNSCTDALFLALKALDISAGDEVITVANTAVPTVAAIRATGALPVFTDVVEASGLLDTTRLEGVITPRTRCVLPVHLYGQPVDMFPLLSLAGTRNIAVIEDCAQAAGASYHGKPVGSMGTLAAFSFYPTKILGACGDGGMVVTNDADLAARIRRLRFYGMEGDYCSYEEGFNSRLDELQAAILNLMLDSFDEMALRRRAIADLYTTALGDLEELELPLVKTACVHQYYSYTIRTSSRDALMQHLQAREIESKILYPYPIHLMPAYRFLGYQAGSLPVTESLAARILSLPIHPALTDGEVEQVVNAVRSFFRSC